MKNTSTQTIPQVPGRFIPENATPISYEDIVVYAYTNDAGKNLAIAYSGRRKKSDFHYNFKSLDEREDYILKHMTTKIKFKVEATEEKAQAKIKADAAFKSLNVGDIFVSSWGYDQTNVDAVQLVAIKGKTGTFRPIGLESIEECSWGSDYVMPVKDAFIGEDTFKKILKGNSFKQSSFQYFRKMGEDREKYYRSWYA